jgi:hypothetical protein
MFIPDPDLYFYPSRIPDLGKKGTRSRIRNTRVSKSEIFFLFFEDKIALTKIRATKRGTIC